MDAPSRLRFGQEIEIYVNFNFDNMWIGMKHFYVGIYVVHKERIPLNFGSHFSLPRLMAAVLISIFSD
jgi:hypothetical protein